MEILWPSPSLSLVKESEFVAKFLSASNYAKYLIEINKSTVTFEDHVEIMSHHFERRDAYDPHLAQAKQDGNDGPYGEGGNSRYGDFFMIPNEQYNRGNGGDRPIHGNFDDQVRTKRPPEYVNTDLNQIVADLDREIGREWDKKGENFIRRRLMAYLLEDRSVPSSKSSKGDGNKKKAESHRDGWSNDTNIITEKQNVVLFGSNPCPKKVLAIKIKVQVLKMLHYLPGVLESEILCSTPCRLLMLEERDRIDELTDQVPPLREQLGLVGEEYSLKPDSVLPCNRALIDQLTIKLQTASYKYRNEQSQRYQAAGHGNFAGGTLRLTKQ